MIGRATPIFHTLKFQNNMPIGNVIKNLIGGKAADIVDSVGNVVDRFVQTKEEKEAAQLEMTKVINTHLQLMEAEVTKQLDIQQKENESARQREIQIVTSDKVPYINKIITPILALLVVIGGGYIYKTAHSSEERTIVISVIMLVLGYYFGSSIGSHLKQERLDKLIK